MTAPAPSRSDRPTAIVFDMGGVLVELGPLTDILGDDPLGVDEFWARWLASPSVREFEMGRCTVEAFGTALVNELQLGFGGDELVARFARWPRGLFPGAVELIADLAHCDVALLSNTNALHWEQQADAAVISQLVDRAYLSFELGLAKPDRAIFEYVIADLAVDPSQIVFLDDNQPNVDAARSLGIEAHLARGVGEARAVLAGLGVFD